MKNEITNRFYSSIGYIWAGCGVIAVIAIFVCGNLPHAVAGLPFVKLHPRYSGGEIVETIADNGTKWTIHRAVFDGLVSERQSGFIQIDVETGGKPVALERAIDWNHDGKPDFTLKIPDDLKGAPTIESAAPEIAGVWQWAKTKTGWIVRVGIARK
jgi:hypothetical protein